MSTDPNYQVPCDVACDEYKETLDSLRSCQLSYRLAMERIRVLTEERNKLFRERIVLEDDLRKMMKGDTGEEDR